MYSFLTRSKHGIARDLPINSNGDTARYHALTLCYLHCIDSTPLKWDRQNHFPWNEIQKQEIRIEVTFEKCLLAKSPYGSAITTGKTPFPVCSPKLSSVGQGWYLDGWPYPVLHFLGSQAGVVKTSITPSTSTTNVVCGLSFSRSQPDFEGFLRALRFPPSAKSAPSLFHLAI